MTDASNHNTTLVGITGQSNDNLHILANLYHEPFDAESVLSVVAALAHKPNVTWNVIYSSETWCTSMDQSQGGTLFIVSMDGEMHIIRGTSTAVVNLDCPAGLNNVWAADDDEAFAVGLEGERVRMIDQHVTVSRDPEGRRLNAVHGTSSSNVFVVGDNGLVFRFDGTTWEELDSPTTSNLLTVLCRSDTEVYIGGAQGILLRWNGINWERFESPPITITSMAFYHNTLYIAAGRDGVFILSDNRLESIKELLLYRLKTIDNLLFGIGNKLVAQFDGTEWWGGNLDM